MRSVIRAAIALTVSLSLPMFLVAAPAAANGLHAAIVLLPTGCAVSRTPVATFGPVRSSFVHLSGQPYGLAVTPNNQSAFVSTDNPPSLRQYSLKGSVPVQKGPNWWRSSSVGAALATQQPGGLALSRSGSVLVVATANGAAVFKVESPRNTPLSLKLIGDLMSPGSQPLEVALSPNGRFVFLSNHVGSGSLIVFDLHSALIHGFGPKDLVGSVSLGSLAGGMTFSPDGSYLYVVSEERSTAESFGSLTTLRIATLEKSPSRAVVSTVNSGCGSVRVVATASAVYVSARNTNSLLSYSASALVNDPNAALREVVDVGGSPIGLETVNHAKGLVVADALGGTGGALAALRIGRTGDLAIAGYVRSGMYPREMTISPDGRRLLVGDWQSDQLQVLQVNALLGSWRNL
jgi:DNA-binding beta-propeller fold protein YncE